MRLCCQGCGRGVAPRLRFSSKLERRNLRRAAARGGAQSNCANEHRQYAITWYGSHGCSCDVRALVSRSSAAFSVKRMPRFIVDDTPSHYVSGRYISAVAFVGNGVNSQKGYVVVRGRKAQSADGDLASIGSPRLCVPLSTGASPGRSRFLCRADAGGPCPRTASSTCRPAWPRSMRDTIAALPARRTRK